MRARQTNAGLTACAIGGTYVVHLGLNVDEALLAGTLGFALFSPRHGTRALQWYAERLDAAADLVILTCPFGVSKTMEVNTPTSSLRYVLLDKADTGIEVMKRDPSNSFSVGARVPAKSLTGWADFMRLFDHFESRWQIIKQNTAGAQFVEAPVELVGMQGIAAVADVVPEANADSLQVGDAWWQAHYVVDSPRAREREVFSTRVGL